jgi:phosphatidate cytidylyltransferase
VTPAVIRAPLWVRLGTLIALAFAIFVPAYFGPVTWALAVLALVAAGLGEFWDMLDAVETPPHRTFGWAAGLMLPATALVWGAGGLGPAMVAGLLSIGAGSLFVQEEASLNARMGGTALGVLYVGLLGAHLVLIGQDGGFGAIVFFVMVVQLADVGGLMAGVLFGKRKLAPHISPGKTLEGAIGSFVAATFGAWAFAFALPGVPLSALFAVGVALAAAGLIGDLLASGFKRGAGLKDFGKVLPGHGGVLDRFDGYLFAAPIFWAWLVLVRWMGWM